MPELSTLGSVIKTAYEGEADTNAFTDAEKTKVGYLTVTGAIDLDSIVSNATHTGDATGDTALSVVALRGVSLDSTVGTPSDGDILVYRSAGADWVLEAKPTGAAGGLSSVADLTALAAISEVGLVSGDTRIVADIQVIYVYDENAASGGVVVMPSDDADSTGGWVPVTSKIVDLSSAYHTGTLSVDYIGGDSGAGDPAKYLNETGGFTTPTGSITTAAADPASAPGSAGVISANTVDRRPWISFGTSVVGDWVRLVTFEDMEVPADLVTATITTSDLLAFGDDSDSGNLKATTLADFITDLSLITTSSTSTLTNKTLTNPKATYTSYSGGTQSSGTYTPSASNGNLQHITNGGAFTLGVPTTDGTIVVEMTNNGSAGAVTTSSFTKVTGDSLTTTDTHVFLLYITTAQTVSHLNIVAMQ